MPGIKSNKPNNKFSFITPAAKGNINPAAPIPIMGAIKSKTLLLSIHCKSFMPTANQIFKGNFR